MLATVAYGLALARGRVTTVAALTFATETVVPALLGVLVLGDRVAPGHGPAAALAFVATLGGCIALAGRAEPTQPTRVTTVTEPTEPTEPTRAEPQPNEPTEPIEPSQARRPDPCEPAGERAGRHRRTRPTGLTSVRARRRRRRDGSPRLS